MVFSSASSIWHNADGWTPGTLKLTRRGIVFTTTDQQPVITTIQFADVSSIVKDVSYWIRPDAITLLLTKGSKEYFCGFADRDSAFEVIQHFWQGWWAAVLDYKAGRVNSATPLKINETAVLSPDDQRRLKLIETALAAGASTAAELHSQTEQIDRIHAKSQAINADLSRSHQLLRGMESWWSIPKPPTPLPSSSNSSSTAPSERTSTETIGSILLQAELNKTSIVLHLQNNGQYCSRLLQINANELFLKNHDGAVVNSILCSEVATIDISYENCQVTLRPRKDKAAIVLISSRLSILISLLRSAFPPKTEPKAGSVRSPKKWGSDASTSSEPAIWTEQDAPSLYNLEQTQSQSGEQAFLQLASFKIDDLNKIATAIGGSLDDQLETLSRTESNVDAASASIRNQIRRTDKLTRYN